MEPEQLVAGCAQSVGLEREQNEDALFCLSSVLAGDKQAQAFGLYIVADGMGGHRNGEIASSYSVRAFSSVLIERLSRPLFGPQAGLPQESLQEIVVGALTEAHRVVNEEASGGGTTFTAALVIGEQLITAHIGDSRLYLISPEGETKVLTRDHSFVNRLVELGQITSEEAAVHPQRNVLYRALGQGEPLEADVSAAYLPHGGKLLLCSDGLWGVVPDQEISNIVQANAEPSVACQKLVDAANNAGGPDNISVILVRLPD